MTTTNRTVLAGIDWRANRRLIGRDTNYDVDLVVIYTVNGQLVSLLPFGEVRTGAEGGLALSADNVTGHNNGYEFDEFAELRLGALDAAFEPEQNLGAVREIHVGLVSRKNVKLADIRELTFAIVEDDFDVALLELSHRAAQEDEHATSVMVGKFVSRSDFGWEYRPTVRFSRYTQPAELAVDVLLQRPWQS